MPSEQLGAVAAQRSRDDGRFQSEHGRRSGRAQLSRRGAKLRGTGSVRQNRIVSLGQLGSSRPADSGLFCASARTRLGEHCEVCRVCGVLFFSATAANTGEVAESSRSITRASARWSIWNETHGQRPRYRMSGSVYKNHPSESRLQHLYRHSSASAWAVGTSAARDAKVPVSSTPGSRKAQFQRSPRIKVSPVPSSSQHHLVNTQGQEAPNPRHPLHLPP